MVGRFVEAARDRLVVMPRKEAVGGAEILVRPIATDADVVARAGDDGEPALGAASVIARWSATAREGWQPWPTMGAIGRCRLGSQSTRVQENAGTPISEVTSQTKASTSARCTRSRTARQPGSSTVARSTRVRRWAILAGQAPEGGRVPLDQLADGVAHRLEGVIAGGEAVQLITKAPLATQQRQRVIGVHDLEGHPDWPAAGDRPLLPRRGGGCRGGRRHAIEASCAPREGGGGSGARIDGAELEGELDVLGVPVLDRLHHAQARAAARVRPLPCDTEIDRELGRVTMTTGTPMRVEAGDVGDAGDAHCGQKRCHPGHRLVR